MGEIRSVIVLDCSGALGLQLLLKAIQQELQVTAFALDIESIPSHIADRLHRVIQGDVLDEEKVTEALKGHDAVFCAIESYNSFSRKNAISQGCQNIIKGMKEQNIKKLAIASDSIALRGSTGILNWFRKRYCVGAEYVRMMDILANETASIDWVAMMLPKVTISQRVNSDYKVEKNNMPGEWSVTSAEAADFMVKVFMNKASVQVFRHNALGISSRLKRPNYITYFNIATGATFSLLAILAYYRLLPPVLQQYIDNYYM